MERTELKEERMKILELLSKKIISAEEAEKLLSALSNEPEETEVEMQPKKKDAFKMLKVLVDSADGDEVRIELPIEFAKLLKNKKLTRIDEDDLDIDIDALIQMINTGVVGEIVNVKSADGDIVRIVVE